MAIIEAQGLNIEFPLYHVASRSLKKRLLAKAAVRVSTDESNRVVVNALRDLTFTIRPGERVALVGHNGAGKTTLVNQVVGLLCPTSGSIRLDGVDAVANPALARRLTNVQAQANVPITGPVSYTHLTLPTILLV